MPRAISILMVAAMLLIGPLQLAAAESLRDPTRPYSARAASPGDPASFVVTAVFVSKERRVAIINGQRVVEGNEVGGATVVEIQRQQIRLNLNGKEITARLLPATSRK